MGNFHLIYEKIVNLLSKRKCTISLSKEIHNNKYLKIRSIRISITQNLLGGKKTYQKHKIFGEKKILRIYASISFDIKQCLFNQNLYKVYF